MQIHQRQHADAATACSFPPTQSSLNGHPSIQYCREIPPPRCWYTNEMQLIFLVNGTITLTCGGENLELRANHLALLKKNIWVEMNTSRQDQENLQYIQFIITSDLVKEFTTISNLPLSKSDGHTHMLMTCIGQGWLAYVLSLETILMQHDKPQGLVKIKMLELLFHLSWTNRQLLEQLLDIREYYRVNITTAVEDNITNSLSIEQLASLSGRSLSSFRRDFMAIYHMPPSQWIRLKRLEKAKEMLLGTTMTVTDICYTLGFEHIAHFSRLFKAHFGYAPSNCRSGIPMVVSYPAHADSF
jgi:AraC family transcriptional regulator, exoenzyme S synthesis regulatory protein ExsA